MCSPSRATILTGTYSHVNGVSAICTEIDNRVPPFTDGTIPEPPTLFGDHATPQPGRAGGVHMTIADDLSAEDLQQPVPERLRGEARMHWTHQIYLRDHPPRRGRASVILCCS